MKTVLKLVGWIMKNVGYLALLSVATALFPQYTIPVVAIILFLYFLSWIQLKGEEILDNIESAELKSAACPHGYEDWDECSTCCH